VPKKPAAKVNNELSINRKPVYIKADDIIGRFGRYVPVCVRTGTG